MNNTNAEGTVMFVTPLFKLMAEKQASDLFFTAGAPIQIKVNGIVMPVNGRCRRPNICLGMRTWRRRFAA